MAKRKINLGGQEVMAEEIQFEPDGNSGGEKWSSYILQDGATLKLKPVVAEVFRVDGMFDANNNPIYSANVSFVVSVSAPEALRRKA